MSDFERVKHHYDNDPEVEWARLDRHRTERAVTLRALDESLEGELWEAWVDLNYQMGKDPSTHGCAEHLLYIGEK